MCEFKSAKFKALRDEWYQKLKASGFDDIESKSGNLRASIDARTLNKSALDCDRRIGYFEQALKYKDLIAAPGSEDFHIWELHCEGRSNREIGRMLSIHNTTVDFRIKKLKKKARLA